MKKNSFLTKTFAAAVLAVAVAGCGNDFEYTGQSLSEEDALANAEEQLGITIDPSKSWAMTTSVETDVLVNGDYGTDVLVKIYENNPLIDGSGVLLAEGSATSGSSFKTTFAAPVGQNVFYVAFTDHKGYVYVKPASLENGVLKTNFGGSATRSATNSNVNIPVGTNPAAYAAEILAKSKELTDANKDQDSWGSYWYSDESNNGIVENENYVINYLISGTWNGLVPKLGAAGYQLTGGWTEQWGNKIPAYEIVPRTVYVTGKWIIPEGAYQVCGNGYRGIGVDGVIVVGKGGELEVNGNLNLANQARLIVLEGGKVTGTGTVTVCNGSAAGEESYNYGTISVKQLNENFGNFFNYGTITSETLIGGAGTSCFVNHGTINVKEAYGNSSAPANLQIKNNCYFVASNTVSAKIIENGANAYLECGELAMSDGEGGGGLGSYMAADAGSRLVVKKRTGDNVTTGNFNGNNTSLIGPASGDYAYVCVEGLITLWNWSNYSGNPTTSHPGMIINKLYLYVGGFVNNDVSINWYNMINESVLDTNQWTNWENKIGDGTSATMLTTKDGFNTVPTEASECAPAFTPAEEEEIVEIEDTYPIYSYAFEDTNGGDYDMNDVVIRAQETAEGKIQLTVVASGATLELNLRLYPAAEPQTGEVAHYEGQYTELEDDKYHAKEVHAMMGAPLEQGQTRCIMLNTGVTTNEGADALPAVITIDKGSYNPACLPLAIYSVKQGEMRLARTGQPPFGIIIPGNWQWPTERVNIMNAYSNTNTASEGDQSFRTFALSTQANVAAHWYNYPVRNVMSK
ncbi:MAG: hypothetical protein IJ527_08025 [Prevotella sp.]|nr:hypothetical protein [Prevotella sp.]